MQQEHSQGLCKSGNASQKAHDGVVLRSISNENIAI